MKKLIVILATCLISSMTYASSFQDFEDALLALNLIDENYQYTDVEKVELFFEEASDELRKEQLYVEGEDPQAVALTFTPYLMQMVFKTSDSFDAFERSLMANYFASDELIQDGCSELYDSKVFYANNYIIEMSFLDSDNHTLGNIELDKYVCQ